MRSAVSYRASNPALILLVVDNHDGIVARRSVLEELGYKVMCACCGSEALELARRQNFELMITVFRMKPMDGLEFIAELRARGYHNAVILLSGFADSLGLQEQNT